MRLQCYKTRPDEAQALTASPKLSAIYLYVPLHLFPLFPLSSRAPLVTLSTRALSMHISFILHFSELYPSALTPSAIFLLFQKMRGRNVKIGRKTQGSDYL